MLDFIKMFGKGIGYTVLSPIFLSIFTIFLIFTIINYLVFEIYNASTFFLGKGCSKYTDLEKKHKKMKIEQQKKEHEYVTNKESGEEKKEAKENDSI